MDPQGQTPPGGTKKKLPIWLKLFVAVAVIGTLLSVAVNIGLSLLGGKGGEKLLEKGLERMIESGGEGTDVKVDIGEKGVTIEGGSGQKAKMQFGEQGMVIRDEKGQEVFAVKTTGERPPWLTEDIPLYASAKITGSMDMGVFKSVTLETDKSTEEVQSFYKQEMSTKGWNQEAEYRDQTTYTANFKKGDHLVTVVASPVEGKTRITLGLTQAGP